VKGTEYRLIEISISTYADGDVMDAITELVYLRHVVKQAKGMT